MINRKTVLIIGGVLAFAIIFSVVLYVSRNKGMHYYVDTFNENKANFYYFANLKDSVFTDNIGCHKYSATMTIKGSFYQSCNIFSVDSTDFFDEVFLNSTQEKRIKMFMNSAKLQAVVYKMSAVSFIFNQGNVYIYRSSDGNAGDIKLDERFYLHMSN